MASPQKENGHVGIANELWDAWAKIRIPGEAMQILMVIIRLTYGWNRKEWPISNREFVDSTGIRKGHIQRNIDKLKSMNLIKVTKKGNKLTPTYCIQKDYEKWKEIPKRVTKKGNAVPQKGNKELPKKGTTDMPQPFGSNGSGDPKDSKDIVLTKVSSGKPPIPDKMNAPEILKWFAALYEYYNGSEYVLSFKREVGIIQQIWIPLGKDIFPIIDHYLALETNQKVFWTTKERTISNLRWQINEIKEHWKEYA